MQLRQTVDVAVCQHEGGLGVAQLDRRQEAVGLDRDARQPAECVGEVRDVVDLGDCHQAELGLGCLFRGGWGGGWSEKGVRLAQKMQVGPCIPVEIQL